jgi:hypothetical protein
MNTNVITPVVDGHFLRIASIQDEYETDIFDPISIIARLRTLEARKIDIFTFAQRIPNIIPEYHFPMEWDGLAVLEYKSHEHWFEKILDDKTRNMIRKAGKKGVHIRTADFDDDLIRGIVEIYNETPIRQGRPFKHFGKTFEETKEANATHLEKSEFVGAFFGTELIGFIKLAFGANTARAEQIISKVAHRDKAPTNALLSEAVKICQVRGLPYLIYGTWPSKESFAQFKKNNGFQKFLIPRYYVPLTFKGQLAVKLRLYKEFKERVPAGLKEKLIAIREKWYSK